MNRHEVFLLYAFGCGGSGARAGGKPYRTRDTCMVGGVLSAGRGTLAERRRPVAAAERSSPTGSSYVIVRGRNKPSVSAGSGVAVAAAVAVADDDFGPGARVCWLKRLTVACAAAGGKVGYFFFFLVIAVASRGVGVDP
jgi:hypothetical protein